MLFDPIIMLGRLIEFRLSTVSLRRQLSTKKNIIEFVPLRRLYVRAVGADRHSKLFGTPLSVWARELVTSSTFNILTLL